MAPEQARSRQDVDARADVFALGCVLFECLTGSPAFAGEHIMAILAKILFDDTPRARELRPDVPEELDDLVSRMLAKDPDARPRDGAALAEELAALRAGAAPSTRALYTTRPAALTSGERRPVSLVVIGREGGQSPTHAETLSASHVTAIEKSLLEAVKAFDGRPELLVDGSVVVTVASASLIRDQAMQAARCALALRTRAGGRPIAVATVRGQVTPHTAVGAAIERATKMLTPRATLQAGLEQRDLSPIVIDDVTAGLLDARFDVRGDGAGLLLQGERELAPGTRTLLGKPTPCVGRDRELRALEQLFVESIEEPAAQAMLVTSPAGVGKSRLAHELVQRLRRRGEPISIWVGRGDSLHAGSPFGLLGQAIRGAFGIQDGEALEARRAKLQAKIAERVAAPEDGRVAGFLGEIIGAPMPDDHSVPLRAARRDAQLMGEQMRRAWVDLALAETSARPLLLVLEDMHWGDLPTVRAVDAALSALKERPLMVLALARPEVHDVFPRLWAERGVQEICLKELSPKACDVLVRHVVGDDVSPELVARIVGQADGNAFYLEELIRAVVEGRGQSLPETVVAMVQSRLQALDDETRRILRAASIFGEVFWDGGVAALLGGGPHRTTMVRDRLADLADRELVARRLVSRFPEERELAFRHALLREGAYATLTEDDQALGHKLAGEWLEARGERDPIVLAEHFERGGDRTRAARHYLRAAEQMQCGSDAIHAITLAERGLACGAAGELRAGLLSLVCEANVWRSERELRELAPLILSHTEEIMRIAAPGSAPWSRAVGARLGTTMLMGDLRAFTDTLEGIQGVDPSAEGVSSLVWAYGASIYMADTMGRLDLGSAAAKGQRELVLNMPERDPVSLGWVNFSRAGRSAYANEDPWDGLQGATLAHAYFSEANHERGARNASLYTSMNLWLLGAHARAVSGLRGIADSDEISGLAATFRSLFLVGALSDLGALEEARLEAERLIEVGKGRRDPVEEGRGRYAVAGALMGLGDLEAAEREARAAIELLAGSPREQPAALVTLARIELARGRAAEALATAEDAMIRFQAIGGCGFFRNASARLVLAEALFAAGKVERARAAIVDAEARLLAQAAKIGDLSYRSSFLEDVPENARTFELKRQWLGE
jgi:hypothetical protein